jgi:hypothetical protein
VEDHDHGRVKKAVKKVFAEGHCEFEASLSTVDRQNIPYILTGYKFSQNAQ